MRINASVAAYWTSVVLGAATVVLVIVNFAVLSANQSIQAEVNRRQQFINQSNQLSRVDDMLIRTLATASVNAKDDKLHDLLTRQGVTLTSVPTGPAPAPGPAAPATAATTAPGATAPIVAAPAAAAAPAGSKAP